LARIGEQTCFFVESQSIGTLFLFANAILTNVKEKNKSKSYINLTKSAKDFQNPKFQTNKFNKGQKSTHTTFQISVATESNRESTILLWTCVSYKKKGKIRLKRRSNARLLSKMSRKKNKINFAEQEI
jgi:hypothetical protein